MDNMKFGKWEITEQELENQLVESKVRGKESKAAPLRAINTYYDSQTDSIVLHFKNGCTFSFPTALIQEFSGASPEDISELKITPSGMAVHWEKLDAQYSIPALLSGIFGTQAWMCELGRRGGSVSSEAKSAASRTNGLKGGRPPKSSKSREVYEESVVARRTLESFVRGVIQAKQSNIPARYSVHLAQLVEDMAKLPIETLEVERERLQGDLEIQEQESWKGSFFSKRGEIASIANISKFQTKTNMQFNCIEDENYAGESVAA